MVVNGSAASATPYTVTARSGGAEASAQVRVVGAAETYEARCRRHFEPRGGVIAADANGAGT